MVFIVIFVSPEFIPKLSGMEVEVAIYLAGVSGRKVVQ